MGLISAPKASARPRALGLLASPTLRALGSAAEHIARSASVPLHSPLNAVLFVTGGGAFPAKTGLRVTSAGPVRRMGPTRRAPSASRRPLAPGQGDGAGNAQARPVAVPPAVSLAQHLALVDELGQDPVGGPLCDADRGGDIAKADPGIVGDAGEDAGKGLAICSGKASRGRTLAWLGLETPPVLP